MRHRKPSSASTLSEVLVALAIVSISDGGVRAAARGHGGGELRLRMLAGWVAEDRLAEHRARGDLLPLGIGRGTQSEGGVELAWREEVIATPDSTFRRVDVFVSAPAEPSRALARLTGFVVQPPPGSKP
jgi:general secretion pathway protein I